MNDIILEVTLSNNCPLHDGNFSPCGFSSIPECEKYSAYEEGTVIRPKNNNSVIEGGV
jgi:hypothetical protein